MSNISHDAPLAPGRILRAPGAAGRLRQWIGRMIERRIAAQRLERELTHLGGLPDHLLADIGVTRDDLHHAREAALSGRPSWYA